MDRSNGETGLLISVNDFSLSINRSNGETGLLISVNYFSLSINRSNGETGLLKAVNDLPFQLTEVMVIFPFNRSSQSCQ